MTQWSEQELLLVRQAQTYQDLFAVAVSVLKRLPQPVIQVSGPIRTGGFGSIKKNMAVFSAAIQKLSAQGYTVFELSPFHDSMVRLARLTEGDQYPQRLLEEFYLPVFESGYIQEVHFLPNWQTSRGAQWEHQQAERLQLKIVYLQASF